MRFSLGCITVQMIMHNLRFLMSSLIGTLLLLSSCTEKTENTNLFNLKWEKYKANPMIEPEDIKWDNEQVLVGSVLKKNDEYLMWSYVRKSGSQYKLYLLASSDGIEWEKQYKKPLKISRERGEWDGLRISKPCVLKTDSGYVMWYMGETYIENKIKPQIGLAYSKDGINWEKFDGNPVFGLYSSSYSWAYFLRYFWILKEANQYKMWFSAVGQGEYKNIESIGCAFSSNGKEWRIHPRPVLERDTTSLWENFYVSNPMVVKKQDRYYLFYGGLGRFGYLFKESIGIARSDDGLKWERFPANPIILFTDNYSAWDREFVTQPRVLQNDINQYYLWYVGANSKNSKDTLGTYQIGLAEGNF